MIIDLVVSSLPHFYQLHQYPLCPRAPLSFSATLRAHPACPPCMPTLHAHPPCPGRWSAYPLSAWPGPTQPACLGRWGTMAYEVTMGQAAHNNGAVGFGKPHGGLPFSWHITCILLGDNAFFYVPGITSIQASTENKYIIYVQTMSCLFCGHRWMLKTWASSLIDSFTSINNGEWISYIYQACANILLSLWIENNRINTIKI